MLELLQNADDCDFPSDALPSLTVTFERPDGNGNGTGQKHTGWSRAQVPEIHLYCILMTKELAEVSQKS